jgi:hypothetical protein
MLERKTWARLPASISGERRVAKKNDAEVAAAARRFVKALEQLEAEGGEHAAKVTQRRQELEAAVASEDVGD